MKTILTILLLAALALWADLLLASAGMTIVALALLAGDLLQLLPDPLCSQDCNQGRKCTCPLSGRESRL